MPLYTYVALAENGAQVSGDSAADSEGALREELASRGLFVQRVRTKRSGLTWSKPRVSVEDFTLFNQEFIALVRAGLTVPDALALASDRPDAPALSRVLVRILEDVRNGMLLSAACERHPEVFERLFIAALRTSEKTGDRKGLALGACPAIKPMSGTKPLLQIKVASGARQSLYLVDPNGGSLKVMVTACAASCLFRLERRPRHGLAR